MNDIIIWLLIVLCLSQSALFSGLTIGLFGLSRLRLEIEAEAGNINAKKVLKLRKDPHLLLSTLLWGNVGVNVLLTLLTDSVMIGSSAFIFSTVFITCFGEILPQAYFTRNALKMGASLTPLVRFYLALLYPVTKPSAIVLDRWLGKEKLEFFKETSLRIMLQKHIISETSDIDMMEGVGALNFLSLDDLSIKQEGSIIDQNSIIEIETYNDRPIFPNIGTPEFEELLEKIARPAKKWIIAVDKEDNPIVAIDSTSFIRDAIYRRPFYPLRYCHVPIIVKSPKEKIGDVIHKLKVYPVDSEDDVIDNDLILYWNDEDPEKIVITGSDILGRLFRGIVNRVR
ncbi:DUF21 domain-containing protein [Methanococcoides sp. FTZ1]|uniref:DUF21 domain-containing protein n=1 Tax=Methanococcoides sp. FTZ1 TaxID=3439061 RepID=UPI003F86C646